MCRPKSAWAIEIALATFAVGGVGDPDAAVRDCGGQPGVPVLAVFVRVMTNDLKAVDGLKATDFALTESGVPQTICAFAHARRPLSVGILLDTSASMLGTRGDLFRMAKAGIKVFLETLEPQDEYFLEYVNAAPEAPSGFTSDLPQIRAKLEITPKGKTALVDAVHLALVAMRKARHLNRALLIFSDAYDNQSARRIEELTATLSDSPVPIFLVVPRERWPIEPEPWGEVSARDNVVRFVSRSGGYATEASSKNEMSAAVTELAAVVRSPYALYYVSSAVVMTKRPIDLKVDVVGAKRRPLVLYRGAVRVTP